MRRFLFILSIIGTLFLVSCKKEMYLFDVPANKNLELSQKLNFNNKPCFFDAETKTFCYSIDREVISDFSPDVEFKDYSNVCFNGQKLINNEINNIGEVKVNTAYDIEFENDGVKNSFRLYFTTLPLIQLITLDAIENEPKILGRMVLNYPELTKESFNTLIGVESRGMSSSNRDKKSYGFKLIDSWDMDDIYSSSFFGMRNSNKWVLDAMYDDISRLKNKTNFEIWSSLSDDDDSHISIQSEYVGVYHNSNLLGVYCFHENLTGEVLGLQDEAELIVGKGNFETTSFRKVSGSGGDCPYWNGWEQKFPDPDIKTNWDSFEDLCYLFVEADDSTFASEVFDRIDLDNVVDYYLFLSLFYGYDNLGKNWYFLQESPDDKFKIVPWDLDATWGRKHNGLELGYDKRINNGFYERLFEVNPQNFKQKVKERWFVLREDEFSWDSVFSIFEANFEILNHAQVDVFENEFWHQDLDLTKEEEYIKDWAKKRFEYLDEFFSDL